MRLGAVLILLALITMARESGMPTDLHSCTSPLPFSFIATMVSTKSSSFAVVSPNQNLQLHS